ncbi:hypothetical protein HK096_007724, partial [Nowakowskiella sp. JEL0078]
MLKNPAPILQNKTSTILEQHMNSSQNLLSIRTKKAVESLRHSLYLEFDQLEKQSKSALRKVALKQISVSDLLYKVSRKIVHDFPKEAISHDIRVGSQKKQVKENLNVKRDQKNTIFNRQNLKEVFSENRNEKQNIRVQKIETSQVCNTNAVKKDIQIELPNINTNCEVKENHKLKFPKILDHSA